MIRVALFMVGSIVTAGLVASLGLTNAQAAITDALYWISR